MNTQPTETKVEIQSETLRHRMKDPGPGRHLWMFAVTFRASDELIGRLVQGERPPVYFDHENMLSAQGPGCFKCEQTFTPQLAAAPCEGSMYL